MRYVVYIPCCAFLLTLFVLQVKECVLKFIDGKTTLALEMEPAKELKLPAFSFCPGYK